MLGIMKVYILFRQNMVDLSIAAARTFWQNFADPAVFRVIALLESVETALPEGEEAFESAMQGLGQALGDSGSGLDVLPEDFVAIIAYLKTSRYLRLLQATDEVKPGTASSIIAHAERNTATDAAAKLFISRNVIFERFRLLSRVLAPDRLKMLAEALEED